MTDSPTFLTTGEQRTLHFVVANILFLPSYHISPRLIAHKTGRSVGTISRHLKKLGKLGFIEYRVGRGKRDGRVCKVLTPGIRFPFAESPPDGWNLADSRPKQATLPLEIPEDPPETMRPERDLRLSRNSKPSNGGSHLYEKKSSLEELFGPEDDDPNIGTEAAPFPVVVDVDCYLEELVKIRELLQPPSWMSTYDAVKLLFEQVTKT